jgi:hypothetical protein
MHGTLQVVVLTVKQNIDKNSRGTPRVLFGEREDPEWLLILGILGITGGKND